MNGGIKDLLNLDRLTASLDADAAAYRAATPFPHKVLDGFMLDAAYQKAMAEFPSVEQIDDWRRVETKDAQGRVAQILKLGYSDEQRLGETLRDLLYALNSSAFIRYLERLTGIPDLLPDPHMFGGGLHQYLPGAILRVHADFNKLPGSGLDRRLNLLLYLNREWRTEWGGDLELWDASMQRCARRLEPTGNRCVVFSTTTTSFHGMPDPLACPHGVTRRSVALYYYSNGRPVEETNAPHSTLWQSRPGES